MNNIHNHLNNYIEQRKIKIPQPTTEQYHILNQIFTHKNNVTISSCPGSGKTTLIQFISLLDLSLSSTSSSTSTSSTSLSTSSISYNEIFQNHNILVLMYNKALAVESGKKFRKNKCKNIRCQTIHSFAYNNYRTKNRSYDDTLLLDILEENTSPITEFDYSMIIIDEFQDATPILFNFVQKIIIDNINDSPQIIVMGDPLQELYKFRGADSRFMTLAKEVFLNGRLHFDSLQMSYTNRCPQNICRLINVCYNGPDSKFHVMKSNKPGGNIRVCIGSMQKIIIDELKLLKQKSVDFSMEDVMIIVPSLKHIQNLKNTLSRNGIYVVVSDSECLDLKTTKNKVLITTFHGSKGLERKICFVTNFSNDYYKFYATDHDPEVISNTFYVALSRSNDYLYLIRNSYSEFPLWCPREYLERLKNEGVLQLYDEPLTKQFIVNENQDNFDEKKNIVSVTELTKNLSNEFKQEFGNIVKFTQLKQKSTLYKYDDVICTNYSTKTTDFYLNGYKIYENISKYIGQSVTIFFELYLYNKQQTKNKKKNRDPRIIDSIDNTIEEILKLYPEGNSYTRYYKKFLSETNYITTFKDILYYCVLREGLNSDDITVLNQIKYLHKIPDVFEVPYDDNVDTEIDSGVGDNYENSKLICCLESIIDDDHESHFEQPISCLFLNKTINGKIDVICNNHRVIEIKFKNSLDIEDYVQLFLYSVIMSINKRGHYNYELYNAKTNEHFFMRKIDNDQITKLMKLLLYPTKNEIFKLTDSEFIEKYRKCVLIQ